MKQTFRVSVLIPTLGRSRELIDTVSALTKQTMRPHEIIVVDQNEPVFSDVEKFFSTIPYVKHITHVPKGVVPNYNLCAKNATGDIFLFIDDDVIPSPVLIEKHIKNYAEDKTGRLGAVAGRVKNIRGDINPAKIKSVGTFSKWTGSVVGHFNGLKRQPVQFAVGANMSFKREAFEAINGFDPWFGGNGYFFETDGGLRLLNTGFEFIFDPEAELDHLLAGTGGARIKDKALHTYYFVKHGMQLFRRHSPLMALPFLAAKQVAYGTAKAIYNFNPRIFIMTIKGVIEGSLSKPPTEAPKASP